MFRPLRVEFPGAMYHVMARGVGRSRVFDDDQDYAEFLRLTGCLVDDGALIAHSFCLMPTHPHLFLETPYGGLGRWMQQLLADYARYYNRRHGRSGHLFQARYKAILVEDGQYLLECSRYIHLNPNRKKLTRFVERIRALEKGLRPVRDITGRRALRQSGGEFASYEFLSSAVEKHFAEMSGCRKRQILAFVLYRFTWLKTTQIADLLERSPAAISMARHRVELWIKSDPALPTALRLLEQEVRGETGAGPLAEASTATTPAWYRAALSRFPLAPIKRKI